MAWLAFIAGWFASASAAFTIWSQKRHEATVRAYQNAIDVLTRCPDCGGKSAGYIHKPGCGVRRVYIEDRDTQL